MRELELPEGVIFPKVPSYCSPICGNALNDLCIEQCSIRRDMSAFELKKGVELPDFPPFPMDDFIHTMNPEERKVIMAVYMAKAVDFIQGRKADGNGYPPNFPGRPLSHGSGHTKDSQSMQGEVVSTDARNEICEGREEHPGTTIGFSEMARGNE